VVELEDAVAKLTEENQRLTREAAREPAEVPLFHIDTDPADQQEEDQHSVETIVYSAATATMTSSTCENQEDKSRKTAPSLSSCFNCKADHILSDCPLPRDYRAIAQNRRQFRERQSVGLNSARYHIDEPQRFGHVKPSSFPSERLRDAMGLRDYQLPTYVYRMRECGYPPGWLKEAEVRHSGVALYLAKDRVLASLCDEDGEVADEECQLRYDVDKLVGWPGFNEDFPSDYVDETRDLRCAAMREDQSKTAMLRTMSERAQTGYVQGEMTDTYDQINSQQEADVEPPGEEDEAKPQPILAGLLSQQVKLVEEGTPIAANYSPFNALPSQAKWAQGTTDLICFENLPNSTGKWEQMKEVLKRGARRLKNQGTSEEDVSIVAS